MENSIKVRSFGLCHQAKIKLDRNTGQKTVKSQKMEEIGLVSIFCGWADTPANPSKYVKIDHLRS